MSLFSTHTLLSRCIHLLLSPTASRLDTPGEWGQAGRSLLQNTIPWGDETSWYPSQTWILDVSSTFFHSPTWMPMYIEMPCISIISFTNNDKDSQHFSFFSYCFKYFTNSRWLCLHNTIIIPISQMKKARHRANIWFGQGHTASGESCMKRAWIQSESSTADILVVLFYCLLMTGGEFFLLSPPLQINVLLNSNWYPINCTYLRTQFDEFRRMYTAINHCYNQDNEYSYHSPKLPSAPL